MPEATIHLLDESTARGRRRAAGRAVGRLRRRPGPGPARPADPALRAAGQVRRRPGRQRSARRTSSRPTWSPTAPSGSSTRSPVTSPTREVKFESYAMARIRGAIIDELRNTDWIPRSVRMKARQFERTVAELEAKLHRTPTDEEVADAMDMDVEEIASSSASCPWSTSSPSTSCSPSDGGGPRLGDTLQDSRAQTRRRWPSTARPASCWPAPSSSCPSGRRSSSALLLRGAHAGRHRPGPRRHREPDLPAAHQGRAPPAHQARRHRLTRWAATPTSILHCATSSSGPCAPPTCRCSRNSLPAAPPTSPT